MNLKKELSSYARLVEKEFPRYVDREPKELYEPLRDLLKRGGKRIRPALCMIASEAVGGRREDSLLCGTSIEMIHNFTLIHDDIADKSELRRGKPCLHHKYGLGLAINAGDGMFSVANEAILDATDQIEEKRQKKILRSLANAVTAVSEGQAFDIGWVENMRWDISEDDYFRMIRGKTGALMAASAEVGAIAGKGTGEQIKALSDFGMAIGVGFQIHDDVLNLRGDEKKYGKEIGGDINEGKRSLIAIYTLSVCTEEEKKFLIRVFDKERNSKEEIKESIAIMKKYGSIDRAAKLAKEMVEDAKKGLIEALDKTRSRDLLIMVADYMIERDL